MATDINNSDITSTPEPERNGDAVQETDNVQLERSTYDIIRNRLNAQAAVLSARLEELNTVRRDDDFRTVAVG